MMLPLALALLLGRDLEWDRIQIEWIASTGTVHNLEDVIPRHQADLLRLLNDDRYLVRKLAADALADMGQDGSMALAWGERVKDKQIALEAAKLRSLLYVCQHCLGDGFCPTCNRSGRRGDHRDAGCPEECGWNRLCLACGGSGDIRYTLEWTADMWAVEWLPGHQGKLPVERDLFGAVVDKLIARGRGMGKEWDEFEFWP